VHDTLDRKCRRNLAGKFSRRRERSRELSIVLRIKRTLESDEIDKIITDVQALKALSFERVRRMRRQRVIENAAAFDHG
jgi:hypothetical protein